MWGRIILDGTTPGGLQKLGVPHPTKKCSNLGFLPSDVAQTGTDLNIFSSLIYLAWFKALLKKRKIADFPRGGIPQGGNLHFHV